MVVYYTQLSIKVQVFDSRRLLSWVYKKQWLYMFETLIFSVTCSVCARDLQINTFLKVCRNLPFTSRNNCKKENSKLKLVKYFFYFSKMTKRCFTFKIVLFFVSVHKILAFKLNKEQILFQVKPLKLTILKVSPKNLLLILGFLGGTRHFLRPCEALRRVKNQQI